METFILTFGSQYAYQPHPHLTSVHPDGWYIVDARDEEAARHLVYSQIGTAWSNLYTAAEFNSEVDRFPRGCMGQIIGTAIPADQRADYWLYQLESLLAIPGTGEHTLLLQEILTQQPLLVAKLTKALLPIPLGHHA